MKDSKTRIVNNFSLDYLKRQEQGNYKSADDRMRELNNNYEQPSEQLIFEIDSERIEIT